jgi:gliding motility-associated protein GldL
MGKYKRYKNRIEMFLSSERGKRVLTFLYSWGAAIVIIGTLFKLLHLPYANQILFIAMITEACVFVISGFERPSSDYNWEEVFPVLKSKNPLDRPDFASGSASDSAATGGGGHVGGGAVFLGDMSGMASGAGSGVAAEGAGGGIGGGVVLIGGAAIGGGGFQAASGGAGAGSQAAAGAADGGAASVPQVQPSPQERVNAGMATMGLNISEEDSEALAESIRKLNSAAEQISKMADLTEVTQTYIDRISGVSQNLEKFSEITGSLGEVSDTLINSCKVISGDTAAGGAEENPAGYVAHMSRLNDNISGLNRFYEAQLSGLHTQIDTIQHINAGLNRIRDMYDSSLVDSAAFRNENERMAQLLLQLNQVYSRLLQAMTVNVPVAGGYPPAGQAGYPQPPYPQGGYQPQGGSYR